jgi:hypothetical protein
MDLVAVLEWVFWLALASAGVSGMFFMAVIIFARFRH